MSERLRRLKVLKDSLFNLYINEEDMDKCNELLKCYNLALQSYVDIEIDEEVER
jgi:hypothetical protein